jgi:hypothetical protein
LTLRVTVSDGPHLASDTVDITVLGSGDGGTEGGGGGGGPDAAPDAAKDGSSDAKTDAPTDAKSDAPTDAQADGGKSDGGTVPTGGGADDGCSCSQAVGHDAKTGGLLAPFFGALAFFVSRRRRR